MTQHLACKVTANQPGTRDQRPPGDPRPKNGVPLPLLELAPPKVEPRAVH